MNSLEALIGQAGQLRAAGRLQESEQLFRKVLHLDGKRLEAWLGLFQIAQQCGRKDDAIQCLSRAYAIHPNEELGARLGRLTRKLGASERARVYREIARLQAEIGNTLAALASIRKALHALPRDAETLFFFSRLLLDVRFTSAVDPAFREDLTMALLSDGSDKQYMVHAVVSALEHEQAFAEVWRQFKCGASDGCFDGLDLSKLNDRLVVGLLCGALVTDRQMELLLTGLRRHFLRLLTESPGHLAIIHCDDFLAALATQCFNNEYIFNVDDQEAAWLAQVVDLVEGLPVDEVQGRWLAIIGAYQPLRQLKGAAAYCQRRWPEPWDSLIELQIRDFEKEAAIKEELESITDIREGVSGCVRDQYEENPFPRWVEIPRISSEKTLNAYAQRLFPGVGLHASGLASPDILVAGCGTGLIPALFARQFPKARILAVDLSRSSLAYGRRKSAGLGLCNIEFRQGDILALGGIHRQFDFINCFGVLHHTADIVESWRVLRDLLKPGGLMQIGLYSKIARESVAAVRDYIAAKGYPATLDGLRQCRKDLLSTDDPMLLPIVNSWSFYSASNFRDLAFHVHEICISIPQLEQMLQELELEFIGFEHDYPEVKARYLEEYPGDPAMTCLANWDQFEKRHPSTFENCYKFWVRRKA